jgi:hypothetical protein
MSNCVKTKRKIWKSRKPEVSSESEDEDRPDTQLRTQLDWSKQIAGLLNETKFASNLVTYFRMFIRKELLMLIVDETNKYAIENNLNKPLDLTVPVFEQWLGIILCM